MAGFFTTTWGDWRYLEALGSDHKVIGFTATFTANLQPIVTLRPLFNKKKADWVAFATALSSLLVDLFPEAQALQ
jgi:hypothetical protein